MTDKLPPRLPYRVLFLCTGNSARSILAEAILNHTALNGGRFRAFSAGSFPKGAVNPLALELLESIGIPTTGLRSKSWDEFAGSDAPPFDFVITVCDQAANEVCPIWPGHPMTAHWGIPDPAAVTGTLDEKRRAFVRASEALHMRIEVFTQLPFDKLDRLALHDQIRRVGQRADA
jgi:protein-tyrosine-phosphatase